ALSFADSKFVVKIAPPPEVTVLRYEHDMMAAEVGAMREVRRRTSLPVPEVVAFDQTREETSSDYFLAACAPGSPLHRVRDNLSTEAQAFVDEQIAGYLIELHDIKGVAFGTYNRPVHSTWKEAFGAFLEDLGKDRRDRDVQLPLGAFEVAEPHMDALDEVRVPSLIHWDLWDPNVFVDDDNRITGVIDFERAMWADPLMEWNFHTPSKTLLDAYGRSIMESPGSKSRRGLYDLYLGLIMVIETTYRGYDSAHEKMSRDFLDASIAVLARSS
ncbi:MAG TPA: aminoglycoside phosphotransferase family protein, partial [Fimbriimonadaceae bacterium]|nr:aminoglycoside phosphotransferase family protein [Fimbriimonadaceae bacterium]